MIGNKKVVCIIPARLASTRFPNKMLVQLGDKPLLEWVWRAANAVSLFDEVHFAVDSQALVDLVSSFGASAFLTSIDCATGSDRLIEIMQRGLVKSDIWVNWQGDEPFIVEQMIHDILRTAATDENIDMWTLKKKITNPEQIHAPNTAKVVTDALGHALYFSRSPIPFYRDKDMLTQEFYKHVGIYAFPTRGLERMAQISLGKLEDAEKLEQLRLLEHGLRIKMHETDYEVFGIDTPQDLARAEALAAQRQQTSAL